MCTRPADIPAHIPLGAIGKYVQKKKNNWIICELIYMIGDVIINERNFKAVFVQIDEIFSQMRYFKYFGIYGNLLSENETKIKIAYAYMADGRSKDFVDDNINADGTIRCPWALLDCLHDFLRYPDNRGLK